MEALRRTYHALGGTPPGPHARRGPPDAPSDDAPPARGAAEAPARVVLLVDDDLDILMAVSDLIGSALENVHVRLAESGAEALDILEHEHVDLVASDYKMALMNGIDFLAAAKRQAPSVPRVLFTAYPDPSLAARAFADGDAAFFVPKMSSPTAIVGVFDALLGGSPASEEWGAAFSSTRPVRNPRWEP